MLHPAITYLFMTPRLEFDVDERYQAPGDVSRVVFRWTGILKIHQKIRDGHE